MMGNGINDNMILILDERRLWFYIILSNTKYKFILHIVLHNKAV